MPCQGLGKTLQTISFLSYLTFERHVAGPSLVVVPLSVSNGREFTRVRKHASAHLDPHFTERFLQLTVGSSVPEVLRAGQSSSLLIQTSQDETEVSVCS